jgi:hypothetical protein
MVLIMGGDKEDEDDFVGGTSRGGCRIPTRIMPAATAACGPFTVFKSQNLPQKTSCTMCSILAT